MPLLFYRDPADSQYKPYMGPPPGLNRNRIINGDFSVNQRGFSSQTSATYHLDRWLTGLSGGTVTTSAQTPAYGDLPESPSKFCRIVTAGQAAAGDLAKLRQSIESVRTLSGKTVTVSFWAKAGSGTPKVTVELNQNFGSGGSTEYNLMVGTVTLSTVWTRYSVTATLPSLATKTIGTSDMLLLDLWVSAGSTYAVRSNNIGIQNNTFDFWGVQLEEGPIATPYEQKTYAQELRDCQRYWFRSGPYAMHSSINDQTTRALVAYKPPVPMRVQPSVSITGSVQVLEPGVNLYPVTSVSPGNYDILANSGYFYAVVASGLTIGRATFTYAVSGGFDFNAEF